MDNAIKDFTEAIRLNPNSADTYARHAYAWQIKSEPDEVIKDYTEAIHLNPKDAMALNNVAWLRATCPDGRFRDGQQAIEYATKACELTAWKIWNNVGTLAAAYAESGDFPNAIKWADKSLELAPENEKQAANQRLDLYRSNQPIRDLPKKSAE